MSYYPVQILDSSGELYPAPLSPSAFDDEFDGDSLDGKWDLENGAIAATPAIATGTITSAEQAHAYNDRRPSWITIQPGTAGSAQRRGISQLIGSPLPSGIYWWRWAPELRGATASTNRDGMMIANLSASSGSAVDYNNRVCIRCNRDPAATQDLEAFASDNGVTEGFISQLGYQTRNVYAGYGAFRVIDETQIQCWLGFDEHGWIFMNEIDYSEVGGQLDRISFVHVSESTAPLGTLLYCLDFFRYKADLNLP